MRAAWRDQSEMFAYVGKVLFFMVLALPLAIAVKVAGFQDWTMLAVWVAAGIAGRETIGRKIDRMDLGVGDGSKRKEP